MRKPYQASHLNQIPLTDAPTLHHRFCAELVAAILQQGGLLSRDSNPAAATPHSLYRLYSGKAAATANPFVLRNMASQGNTGYARVPLAIDHAPQRRTAARPTTGGRSGSPPRAAFRVQGDGISAGRAPPNGAIKLSLKSLGARD